MNETEEVSVIDLVNELLKEAIESLASDIHLESMRDFLRVRYRIDGLLYDRTPIAVEKMLQVVSRIKVLAHIDIAERRLPHDGKFRLIYGDRAIDIRISTFPSLYGEKVVIRILDHSRLMLQLDAIGLTPSLYMHFTELLKRSNGFLLVTGPTGSGKTTTLYAALAHIQTAEKNIVTLEDPVEYTIEGITQSAVHPEIGFTFVRGIRALMRQDPDIIMVGEIRDRETAQVAIQAALTGHLVLSTLHTQDATGALMRLIDMGIEPFFINAALTGILAQRLARKICSFCKAPYAPTAAEHAFIERYTLPIKHLYKGEGCAVCLGLGYKGRIGIFELLEVRSSLRELLTQKAPFDTLYRQACSDGMYPLLYDAAIKVQEGLTTIQEVMRVVL